MKSDIEQSDRTGQAEERLDNRVIPVMREAVAAVQMILYGQLKTKLVSQYSDWEADAYKRLVGCIVNDIFGTPAQDDESRQFARTHLDTVEKELNKLAENVPDLLPQLTDALRMQTLCDHEEGVNSIPTLLRARALNILQEDRPIPMPSTFMIAVRQLGAKHGMLTTMQATDSSSE